MDLRITQGKKFNISSNLTKGIVYVNIPSDIVKDGRVNDTIHGNISIEEFLCKALGWESVMFAISYDNPWLAFAFDQYLFRKPEIHECIYECL